MIILAKAKRKKDGTIDAAASADIKAVKGQDISEISRENDGQVLVRFDNGDPGEYYDAVRICGDVILSGELRTALAELEEASPFKGLGGLKKKGGVK